MLFGDAASAMPTPATHAERNALMGAGSPSPSFDIRGGPDGQFPGLDAEPPVLGANNGKPGRPAEGRGHGQGIGGWISNLVRRGRQGKKPDDQGEYRRVDQDEEG